MSTDQKLTSLAEAERIAQQIIREASQRKDELVAQAKDVAQTELEQIKQKKTQELNNITFDLSKEKQALSTQAETSRKEAIDALNDNERDTLDYVEEIVMRVNLVVFKNLKADFEPLKTMAHG